MTVVDASTLTVAELVALLTADRLAVDAGCDLLDADDNLIADITDDFVPANSSVDRAIYRTVHGTARLTIDRDIQWGSQRLRPFVLISDDDTTWVRWNLGVYLPSTPERSVTGSGPAPFNVACMDKLDVLNTPHGTSVSVAPTDFPLSEVETLITGAGESKVNLDQTAAATAAGSTQTFSIVDEDQTTLQICNALLDSVGYEALWVDRDGWFRSNPYRSPADRPTTWTVDAAATDTIIAETRTTSADYYKAANKVTGIRTNVDADAVPVVGDGIYVAENVSDGETSQDARGGRVITRVIRGEYANHAALVTAVDAALDSEKRVAQHLNVSTSPLPPLWHYSVMDVTDPDAGLNAVRYLVTNWTLPLNGADMRITGRAV